MKYNHIDFNGEWASTKSVEAFIDHEKHHGLSEQELREIHALILIEQGVQPEPAKSIEHGDNTSTETEGINSDKLIEHGDNTGVQKEADIPEGTDGAGGSDIDQEDGGEPGATEQGTNAGRKKKRR